MKNIGSYPSTRLRRNRKKEWSRRLVQENTLSPNDLIWPIFICEGKNTKERIHSMPGIYRHSIDRLEKLLESAFSSSFDLYTQLAAPVIATLTSFFNFAT